MTRTLRHIAHGLLFNIQWNHDDYAGCPWSNDTLCGEIDPGFSYSNYADARAGRVRLESRQRPGHNYNGYTYNFRQAVLYLKGCRLTTKHAIQVARKEAKWLTDWLEDKWWYSTATIALAGTDDSRTMGLVEESWDYSDSEALENIRDFIDDSVAELARVHAEHVQKLHRAGGFPLYI